MSSLTGRTAIDRLIHIMMICPSIAPEAFQLCVQHIHQSREPALYQNLLQAYEQLASTSELPLPNMMDLAQLDTKWADEIITKNQADRVKLEVELKTYSNNMIKESIRVCLGFVFSDGMVCLNVYTLDGASRFRRFLSFDWRLWNISKTLHQITRILYDESTCSGHVHVYSRGMNCIVLRIHTGPYWSLPLHASF